MDYIGDDRDRRYSTSTTVGAPQLAHSRHISRESETHLTGVGGAGGVGYVDSVPPSSRPSTSQYVPPGSSRPSTSQYARDFANNHWPQDSQLTLQDGPPDSPTSPIIGLGGRMMGEKPPEQTRSKGHTALIMSALCMAVFLAALDTTIITTALPTIAEHFQSASGYTWIGSGYMLSAAASTPIWGKVSDIFGRKPILMIANGVFLIGSLLAGLSSSIGMLIVGRCIQGLGGGGLLVLVNICISDLFSIRVRGQYYGLIGGTWALAAALGPLLGGIFTEDVTWRWCFFINLPLDGAALIVIFFALNDLHKPSTPILAGLQAIDWIGCVLIVGGTLMTLLGLQFGGESHPWTSAIVLCLIIFGLFTICLFVFVEWRLAPYPVIPLDIFYERSNLACIGVCFCHGITFMGGAYYLPLFFQTCLGGTPILSGVYTLATALPLSILSGLTGVFIKKTGNYMVPILFGFSMMTLGYGLFFDLRADSSWPKIILYQIVAGFGVGPLFQSPLIALQSLVPRGDIGAATATFQFTRNFATAISVVIGGVVFQNVVSSEQATLNSALGPERAHELSGFNAGAEVGLINSLPAEQKAVARTVFADGFHYMWIMYFCFAVLGLLTACLIKKNDLSTKHEKTHTGLEFEEQKRRDRESRRLSRKSLRMQSDPELARSMRSQVSLRLDNWRASRAMTNHSFVVPPSPLTPTQPTIPTEDPPAYDDKTEAERREEERLARRARRESRTGKQNKEQREEREETEEERREREVADRRKRRESRKLREEELKRREEELRRVAQGSTFADSVAQNMSRADQELMRHSQYNSAVGTPRGSGERERNRLRKSRPGSSAGGSGRVSPLEPSP